MMRGGVPVVTVVAVADQLPWAPVRQKHRGAESRGPQSISIPVQHSRTQKTQCVTPRISNLKLGLWFPVTKSGQVKGFFVLVAFR